LKLVGQVRLTKVIGLVEDRAEADRFFCFRDQTAIVIPDKDLDDASLGLWRNVAKLEFVRDLLVVRWLRVEARG
jgi:hypothetical protein